MLLETYNTNCGHDETYIYLEDCTEWILCGFGTDRYLKVGVNTHQIKVYSDSGCVSAIGQLTVLCGLCGMDELVNDTIYFATDCVGVATEKIGLIILPRLSLYIMGICCVF